MGLVELAQDAAQSECALAVYADFDGLDGFEPAHTGNDQIALEALIKYSKPSLMVHVMNRRDEASLRRLRLIANAAGIDPCVILAVTPAQSAAHIAALAAKHQQQIGLVLLDSSLALPDIDHWAGQLKGALTATGILFVHWPMCPPRDSMAQEFARNHHIDLTMGSDYWYCSQGHATKPYFPCQLVGWTNTFKFGSLLGDLTPIVDRNVFLSLTKAGVPCRYALESGEVFENEPAIMLPLDENGQEQSFRYGPEFEASVATEGGSLMYARNLRMQGIHAYLYSAHDTLYDESLAGASLPRQMIDGRQYVPGYEQTISRETVTLRGQPQEITTALFMRPIAIEEDVVIVNAPHPECYNHWVDFLMSKFWYLDQFPELASLPIVMTPIQIRYVEQYLKLLGIDDKFRFIFYDKSVCYHFKSAYIPTVAALPCTSPANVRWIRDKLLKHADKVPEGFEDGLYYTTRAEASHGILNDQEIIDFLTPLGFKCLDWGKFTIPQQIALAQNAKVVIGEHGSNHTNLIFANSRIRHLFFQTRAFVCGADWNTFIASQLGGKVYAVTAAPATNPGTTMARLRVDMPLFKMTFNRMMDELGQ